eukprot:539504-Amphidinium_carterae.2
MLHVLRALDKVGDIHPKVQVASCCLRKALRGGAHSQSTWTRPGCNTLDGRMEPNNSANKTVAPWYA